MKGFRLATGYAGLLPQRALKAGHPFIRVEGNEGLQRSLRVASVKFDGRKTSAGRFGFEILDPLPRARLVSEARRTGSPGADIASLDVGRIALVSESIELEAGRPGQARIVAEAPGEIDDEVSASTRQLLVLSEGYHPGWHATAEGTSCDILRAYGDLMGCVVEAGAHRLRFRFEPESLRVGKTVSAFGLVLAFAWCGVLWRRGPGSGSFMQGGPT